MAYKLKALPLPVQRAVSDGFPLYWIWFDPGMTCRTVYDGYALFAVTGHHENGTQIERRLYLAYEADRAKQLNGLLKDYLSESSYLKLKERLDEIIFRRETIRLESHRRNQRSFP
ncbi:MAG: hypothetical protein AAGU11_16755 [Syntrophobacteraceae bacterium]